MDQHRPLYVADKPSRLSAHAKASRAFITNRESYEAHLKDIIYSNSTARDSRSFLPEERAQTAHALGRSRLASPLDRRNETSVRRVMTAANEFGVYPLSTSERLHAVTLKRLEEERRVNERKAKADALRERFEAKKREQQRLLQAQCEEEQPPVSTGHGGGLSKANRLKFKRAIAMAHAVGSMQARPPERKTRKHLQLLKMSTNRIALQKILYEWPTVQAAFRVLREEMPWPCSTAVQAFPEDHSYTKGPKGTVGIEAFFALLHHCCHMTRSEQAFVVEGELKLKGATAIYGLGPPSKHGRKGLKPLPRKKRRHRNQRDCLTDDTVERLEPSGVMSEEGPLNDLNRPESSDEDEEINEESKGLRARELGLPSIIGYTELLDALSPSEEMLEMINEALAKKASLQREQDASDRGKQLALLEAQAERKESIVSELRALFALKPSLRPFTVNNPPFSSLSRGAQIQRILETGSLALQLLRSQTGDFSELTRGKKQNDAMEEILGSAGVRVRLSMGLEAQASVRECVIAAVKYGNGLVGLSAVECVESLWLICAERIQSCWRGLKARQALKRIMVMWLKKETEFKRSVVLAWRKVAMKSAALKRHCRRVVYEWKMYVRRLRKTHELFRVCFWPLYTWRKNTRELIVHRQKARLIARLYHTYLCIRVFRGWRRWYEEKCGPIHAAIERHEATLNAKMEAGLRYWHHWAHRRRKIRRIWNKRANHLSEQKRIGLLWKALVVWRYWRFLRVVMERRSDHFWRVHSRLRVLRREEAVKQGMRKHRKAKPHLKKPSTSSGEQQQLLDVPPLPSLGQLCWGQDLPQDMVNMCEPLIAKFEAKMEMESAYRHMLHWREGPHFFRMMRVMVIDRKKETVALKHASHKYKRSSMQAWRSYVIDRISRRRRREGRAMRRDKLRAKRRQLIRLAELENDMETISRLHREEEEDSLAEAKEGLEEEESSDDDGKLYSRWKKTSTGKRVSQAEASGWGDAMDLNGIKMINEDRKQRAKEAKKISSAAQVIRSTIAASRSAVQSLEKQTDEFEGVVALRAKRVDDLLTAEGSRTSRAVHRELKYMDDIKLHIAEKIARLLATIREEMQISYCFGLKWRYFRRIRLCLFISKSVRMRNKAILKNYLRICKRLQALERGMPKLYTLKLKYRVLKSWIKLVRNHQCYQTPALKRSVVKRWQAAEGFSALLASRGVSECSFEWKAVGPLSSDVAACLQRWKVFVSDTVRERAVNRLLAWRRRLRFLRHYFRAFATTTIGKEFQVLIGPEIPVERLEQKVDYSQVVYVGERDLKAEQAEERERRLKHVLFHPLRLHTFTEKRLHADLALWSSRYLSRARRALPDTIRALNRRRTHCVKRMTRSGPSFKRFLHGVRTAAVRRLRLERSLLVEAFHGRGRLGYTDYMVAPEPSKLWRGGDDDQLSCDDSTVSSDGGGQAQQEDNFRDAPIWGGYCISEVYVFADRRQGIMGISSKVEGDGKGQLVMQPKDGVSRPHGACAGDMLTFTLNRPYEQINRVTLLVGAVIEAIQFHTIGPDGSFIRSSPVMGHPFSPKPKSITLTGHGNTDVVAGFMGRSTRFRVTALGLTMRRINECGLFSYAWTPSLDVASSMLNEHLEKRHAAMRLRRAQPAKTVDEFEARRLVVEQAKDEERLCERGEWTVARSSQEDAVQVGELMQLIRTRQVDVESAMDRAEGLARRLWRSQALALKEELAPLRKLCVITGLCKWYFESLARSLAPEAKDTTEADALLLQGNKKKDEMRRCLRRSAALRRQALHENAKPRLWRTVGLLTPQDRKSESDFKERMQKWYSEAEQLKLKGDRLMDEADRCLKRSRQLLPALPLDLKSFMYYYSRLELARTQTRLQGEFGREFFMQTLHSAGARPQAGLTDGQFEVALRNLSAQNENEEASTVASFTSSHGIDT